MAKSETLSAKQVIEAYRATLGALLDEISGIPICTDVKSADELYRRYREAKHGK